MRTLSQIGSSIVVTALCGLATTCDGTGTNVQPSPTNPSVVSVEITGPGTIAPGQAAQFNAVVRLSNGTNKFATTPTVRWSTSSGQMFQVNGSGVVTAGSLRGEAILSVEVPAVPASGTRRSSREVVVVPDGTYRVVGLVSDAESPTVPLSGARVEVVGGISTTTASDGRYKLYGVPADADIQVTRTGYGSLVRSVHLTAHATQNFPLVLSGTRLELSGPYTLVIEVVDGCPGSRPLPLDLQRRSYEAVLTQNGATADVTLTEPRFKINNINRGNRFGGRVDAAGASFTLDAFNTYYYGYYGGGSYPNVAERLSNGTFLVPWGTAVTTGSRAGLSGTMNGGFENWDQRFPTFQSFVAGCSSSSLRFTLTPR